MSKTAIAQKYSLSVTRICQILAEDADVPDEDHRAYILAGLQGGIERLQTVIDGPGRPITSGKGDHVIDANTGEPAYDPSPVNDAIRTKFQGLKNMAQLLGSEKPPAKSEPDSSWAVDVQNWMQQVAGHNEQLRVENERLQARLSLLENAHPAEIVEFLLSLKFLPGRVGHKRDDLCPVPCRHLADQLPDLPGLVGIHGLTEGRVKTLGEHAPECIIVFVIRFHFFFPSLFSHSRPSRVICQVTGRRWSVAMCPSSAMRGSRYWICDTVTWLSWLSCRQISPDPASPSARTRRMRMARALKSAVPPRNLLPRGPFS